MWSKLRPFRSLGILHRIASLLEENNQLLREMHLALTGRHAQTPKRSVSPQSQRIRTAKDVFFVQPTTEEELIAHENAKRESAATPNAEDGLRVPFSPTINPNSSQAGGTSPTVTPSPDTAERSAG